MSKILIKQSQYIEYLKLSDHNNIRDIINLMKNLRGGTHTTLTETAETVVAVLETIPGVTLVSPGKITKSKGRSGLRYVTAVFTTAGMELLITGQGVQKVAVHCNADIAPHIFVALTMHKKLAGINFKTRERKPGM